MISALFFLSLQGEIVLSRFYRDDVDRSVVDAFRIQVIANKEVNRPIAMIDRTSFLYVRKADMYVLAVTKANSNPVLVFEFLFQLIRTFEAYFGAEFNENGIRNNFVVIFELLDGHSIL
jgi:AP-2 complex subunit mu-1